MLAYRDDPGLKPNPWLCFAFCMDEEMGLVKLALLALKLLVLISASSMVKLSIWFTFTLKACLNGS